MYVKNKVKFFKYIFKNYFRKQIIKNFGTLNKSEFAILTYYENPIDIVYESKKRTYIYKEYF